MAGDQKRPSAIFVAAKIDVRRKALKAYSRKVFCSSEDLLNVRGYGIVFMISCRNPVKKQDNSGCLWRLLYWEKSGNCCAGVQFWKRRVFAEAF